jgi:hypothetical protein
MARAPRASKAQTMLNVAIDPRDVYKKIRRVKDLKTRKKILKAGLRAAAAVPAKIARKTVSRDTGTLRKNITIKTRHWGATFIAGIHGKNRGDGHRNPVRYLHLLERGTKPHFQPGPMALKSGVRVNVMHPGTKGTKVLENAGAASQAEAVRKFGERVQRELDKL